MEDPHYTQSWEAMQTHSSRGKYIYLSRDDDQAVRSAHGANWQRLATLKRRFDPSNVFHFNRNIR